MMDAKPHIQTWQSMAKVVALRQVTSTRLLYANPVIMTLTKEVSYPRMNVKKCGLWLT
jgi:hypothetical protein